jgi:hypothetical protein
MRVLIVRPQSQSTLREFALPSLSCMVVGGIHQDLMRFRVQQSLAAHCAIAPGTGEVSSAGPEVAARAGTNGASFRPVILRT